MTSARKQPGDTSDTPRVLRFEVRPKAAEHDPRAEAVRRDAASIGEPVTAVRVSRIYLVRGDFTDAHASRIAGGLLGDPVLDDVTTGASKPPSGAALIEVHPLPGVMDPAAQTVAMAVRELTGVEDVEAATGWRYEFEGADTEREMSIARRLLANTVVHAVHTAPF